MGIFNSDIFNNLVFNTIRRATRRKSTGGSNTSRISVRRIYNEQDDIDAILTLLAAMETGYYQKIHIDIAS